jgi:formate hydrogenlyase subunit 4
MSILLYVLYTCCALLIPGVIAITKAKLSGRKGPGLWQPIYDILRLLRKGSVYSTTTSYLYQYAPLVNFAAALLALAFVPLGDVPGLMHFQGDFVFFAYLLGLGKFLLILNAMDTGSGFEGMGANREALYSMLAEPAFFIVMGSMALLSGHNSFVDIFSQFQDTTQYAILLGFLGAYILGQVAMVENSRLPVDDPRTHLELTMVHEVMVLDNSGFDFGIIMITNSLKFGIYAGLLANLMVPVWLPLGLRLGFALLIAVLFGVMVGLLESFRARNKMARNPQFILTLSAVSLLFFFTVMIIANRI